MAHLLQSVLGVDERIFKAGLTKLEKSTGNSSVDVRLIADIHEKAHVVMRKLGLDIRDTTGHELYFALHSAVKHNTVENLLINTDYVLMIIDNITISFNIIDVIENTHHDLSFDKQIISHGQRALRGELLDRYINHARTNEQTTRETISSMGLLPESDACYNNHKNYKNTDDQVGESIG